MPVFTVRRRVDAYVDYLAQVEAPDAQSAAEQASDDERSLDWAEDGTSEFSTRLFITLDRDGEEIADTEVACG